MTIRIVSDNIFKNFNENLWRLCKKDRTNPLTNLFKIENDLTLLKKKIENEKGIFLRAQTTQKGFQSTIVQLFDW